MIGSRNTIASKINDIREETKTAEIVGHHRNGGGGGASSRRLDRLRNKRSPLTSMRQPERNGRKPGRGDGELTPVGLAPKPPPSSGIQRGVAAKPLYNPHKKGKGRHGSSPDDGGRGGAVAKKESSRVGWARLDALNEAIGRPDDEATQLMTRTLEMMDLADDLRGRIATSYNAAHVERRLKNLIPKIGVTLEEARRAMVSRADARLANVKAGLERLEGYMTVHVDNSDAHDQAATMQKVHSLVSDAQDTRGRSKASPGTAALAYQYIEDVEAAHKALDDAGSLLTKLAAKAIEEALEQLDKAQKKLYRLKARVMKRTPQARDDFSSIFPELATADNVIKLAQAAKENMIDRPNSYDCADAFISAAAGCPAAVADAAEAVQKRAITEAAHSINRVEALLGGLKNRTTSLDSARRRLGTWTKLLHPGQQQQQQQQKKQHNAEASGATAGDEGAGGSDSHASEPRAVVRARARSRAGTRADQKREAQRSRLEKGVDAAGDMAAASITEAGVALQQARAAHKDLRAAGSLDKKLGRAFIKAASVAMAAVDTARRRCAMREAAIVAAARHALHIGKHKLATLVMERKMASKVAVAAGAATTETAGGGAGGDRVSKALASADAAVAKAGALAKQISQQRALGEGGDVGAGGGGGAGGSGSGGGGDASVHAMFGDQARPPRPQMSPVDSVDDGEASRADSGSVGSAPRRLSDDELHELHTEFIKLVDGAHGAVAIAVDCMRAVRLTAAGRVLKRSQQRLAAILQGLQEDGVAVRDYLAAVRDAQAGVDAAQAAKQHMSDAPNEVELAETFIVVSSATEGLLDTAEQAMDLRGREVLNQRVSEASSRMTVVRAEMDQLDLLHRSLGDGDGAGVSVPELELASRLMADLDALQSQLMDADSTADEEEVASLRRAFVSGVPTVAKAVQDAELALRAIAKRHAASELSAARAQLQKLAASQGSGGGGGDGSGDSGDAAAEALAKALALAEEAEQKQRLLSKDARSKAHAQAFISAAANTKRMVQRVKEAMQTRYRRRLNLTAVACEDTLAGFVADVEQLQFMQRATASHLAGADAGADALVPTPELQAALEALDVAQASADRLRGVPSTDEQRWPLAEQLQREVTDAGNAIARADAAIRGKARTEAIAKLELHMRTAQDLERQNQAEGGASGEVSTTDGPAKALEHLQHGLAQAEASRVRLADAMQNIGKKGNDGSSTPSKGGSGHTTIDRDMAHLIDSFVHAVNAIDGMVDDVSHAFTSRRKSALDKASSEAFAALRYLRAGVDGLASRVRAANMRTTPQEVVAAQSSLQHVADLQSKMAAAPKGPQRDACARNFIASIPGLQRAAAAATQVLNTRDENIVRAAATLLDECRRDVDIMRARNAIAGQPYDEATKLVDIAASALASCESAHDRIKDGSVDEVSEARDKSLSMSRTGGADLAAAMAALQRQSQGGTTSGGVNIIDPATDTSFKGLAFDTTTAVRFTAQVTECHDACAKAATAVKQRDAVLFKKKVTELAGLEQTLPTLRGRNTLLDNAIVSAVAGAPVVASTPPGDKSVATAFKGVPEQLVAEVCKTRAAHAAALDSAATVVAQAKKAVAAVPGELLTLPAEKLRGHRRSLRGSSSSSKSMKSSGSVGSVSDMSAAVAPAAGAGAGSGSGGGSGSVSNSPNKRPRRSHRRSSSKVSATSSSHSLSPSLSLSSLRRGIQRVHSLSSMAAAVSLREYSAEPGDAMVSLVGQAAAAVAEAVTQAKTVDAALMEVARHAVKALAATSALTDLAVNREKESRARAEGVASVDASRGQAAVETAKLGVVAAQSLQDSVEREMRRLSKRSRRGSVRNRRRSITALRPGGLTGSGDTPRARVQGPPEDDVAAEDDIRTVILPFHVAVHRAGEAAATAVRTLDKRDADVLAATKQRLGGEVLAASEELTGLERQLRALEERLVAVASQKHRLAHAHDSDDDGDGSGGGDGGGAITVATLPPSAAKDRLDKLRAAIDEAASMRAVVLNHTSASGNDKAGRRRRSDASTGSGSDRLRRVSGGGAKPGVAVRDESAFSDAETFVALVGPCKQLVQACIEAVVEEEGSTSAGTFTTAAARIAQAAADAEFLQAAVQMYRDLAKRSKEREATSKRRAHGGQHLAAFQEINASTNSVNSVSSISETVDSTLQEVVVATNLACQVVADAVDARERAQAARAKQPSGASGSGAGAGAGAGAGSATQTASEVATSAKVMTFYRLSEEAESAVAKAADLMQDHSTSVITGAITVLDSAQDDLASLKERSGSLGEVEEDSPLTQALRIASDTVDDTDTCHKSLLRLDEMGDWQAVVKGAPTFADKASLAVQKLATARDLLAVQEANVATTLQRSDELLAQIVQGLADLTARAKVLTLGSEHIQCRLDRSTGMELLTAAKDAVDEAKARQEELRNAGLGKELDEEPVAKTGGSGKGRKRSGRSSLPPSQVTLKRRFADAVPRAAAALDAAVEAIHTEEGLLRAYTIGIRDLGAIEQQLEGMLRLFEANEPLKSNPHVNEAVEAGVEAVLTASGMRDEMSRPADPDAEIAMHGHAPGAPSGDSSPATNILAVLHAMPAPEALQAWMVAIQETGPLVTRAYQVVMQQLRGKDVVVRTMVTERRKAEVLLQRTEDQLNQCKGRVEERIMSARGDAKTMLAAQARRNDAFKAVDRAICAVNDAMSALDAFDAQPVPNAADLVALSSSVSDAKVLADFAYELVADVTDNGKSEEHTKTWGVRVLQRSRALVADAAEKVKDGKVVVTKLERHTAFNISQAECETTLAAAAELVMAADQVYHVAKKRFQLRAALNNQQALMENLDELEYVLIDAARAGVISAISGRVVGAVKSHFNSIVIEARQLQEAQQGGRR